MQIEILGTSGMVPTKERNPSSIFLFHEKESLLFDCGEGTQRQIKIAGIDMNRISRILITHWHGDHVLGLAGLIQTLASQNYSKKLFIYGPKGSKTYLDHTMKGFSFDNTRLEIEVVEVPSKGGLILKTTNYSIESRYLEHSVPVVGFRFVENDKRKINLFFTKKKGIPEGPLMGKLQDGHDIAFKGEKILAKDATKIVKGKVFAYVTDTLPCENAVILAKDADLLICESMHLSGIEDKTEETKHMNAKQSALIANNANSKKLILTHFSQRYREVHELEQEAKSIFINSEAARDFMKIKL